MERVKQTCPRTFGFPTVQDRSGWRRNKWSDFRRAGPTSHRSPNVRLQARVALDHFLFANVHLLPFSVVATPSDRHGLWLGRSAPGMDLSCICAGSAPFSVVAARRDLRHRSKKRTRRVDGLLGGVGSCLIPFALFPSQSFLDFLSFSGNRIQEVVHVGFFDFESAQERGDGGRDKGWPRGSDSIRSHPSARRTAESPGRSRVQTDLGPRGRLGSKNPTSR